VKGINKVFLLGNVGREPEIKATAGGQVVANFSLATADRQKDQQGSWVDKTEWHNVIAFGRTAEVVRDHVKKGSQIHVEGKLQTRSWDDKSSGQKKYRTEVFVAELVLLGGSGQGSHVGNNERTATTQNSGRTVEDFGGLGITDDDIPF
jgi:single-strand DNA-binding protein